MRRRSVVSSFICSPPLSDSGGFQISIFKRSQNVSTYKGKWAACSGSIEPTDSSPESAARREIEEETTLTGADISLFRRGKSFSFIDSELQTEWTIYPFAFQLKPHAKTLQIEGEHTEYRFIAPSELANYETVPNLDLSLSRIMVGAETEAELNVLKNDHQNGAQVLATMALKALLKSVRGADLEGANTKEEFWVGLRLIAWHLAKNGRPSMSSAIEAALFKALNSIQARMTIQTSSGPQSFDRMDLSAFKVLVETTLDETIIARHHSTTELVKLFTQFITKTSDSSKEGKTSTTTIVTLSSSSTITKCLTDLIWTFAFKEARIKLSILESRPLFEGISLANSLLDSLSERKQLEPQSPEISKHLEIEILSDASVAVAAKKADFVVMGADKVFSDGDVSNKIGSLTLAVMAKTLNPKCSVMAVFDTDKITGSFSCNGDKGDNDEGENNNELEIMTTWPLSWAEALKKRREEGYSVDVKNEYFECVPARYIDFYISEQGRLGKNDIVRISLESEDLEKAIFVDL